MRYLSKRGGADVHEFGQPNQMRSTPRQQRTEPIAGSHREQCRHELLAEQTCDIGLGGRIELAGKEKGIAERLDRGGLRLRRELGQHALRVDGRGVAAAIVGATSARHLAENIGVFDVTLTPEDEAAIQGVLDRSTELPGDCYDLERDKDGRHGSIMRYNQNALKVS